MTRSPDASSPEVTIAMPVYNAGPFLAAALDGILAQSFADWELVAVDDGSTDDSLAVLRRYAARDPRIGVRSRPNAGVVATRNEILAAARGRWMAVNDADDVSAPHRLARQLAYLREHPACVALGSAMRVVTPQGDPVYVSSHPLTHAEIDAANLTTGGAYIGHSTAILSTATARAVGGYRAEFRDGAEDFDLWLRLAERGELANLPEVLVDYRLHAGSMTHTARSRQSRNAARAVADACRRRGLPIPVGEGAAAAAAGAGAANQGGDAGPPQHKWVRQALWHGEYRTARRVALGALRDAPRSGRSWATLGLALLGPVASRYFHAKRALRGG